MPRITPCLIAACVLLAAAGASTEEESAMTQTSALVRTYYEALGGQADFGLVAMAPDLHFESPRFTLESEEAFRQALAGLVGQVRQLEIRQQVLTAGTALTFYQLDLGAPDGPIPMAERLTVVDGRLVDVQLIFDSARLPAPPAN